MFQCGKNARIYLLKRSRWILCHLSLLTPTEEDNLEKKSAAQVNLECRGIGPISMIYSNDKYPGLARDFPWHTGGHRPEMSTW